MSIRVATVRRNLRVPVRPISAQSYLRGCYRAGHGQAAVETTGSKRSYALTWCMTNNDDVLAHCPNDNKGCLSQSINQPIRDF